MKLPGRYFIMINDPQANASNTFNLDWSMDVLDTPTCDFTQPPPFIINNAFEQIESIKNHSAIPTDLHNILIMTKCPHEDNLVFIERFIKDLQASYIYI